LIYGASGDQQVGYAQVSGVTRASLWSGTADSWVDLHAFLPAGFSYSFAQGISSDGVNTYIAGYGRNTLTNLDEALLWTRPIPTPGVAGLLGLGGVVALRRRRGVGR
jgi:MYXO-CTERM domain-containing protein